MTGRLSTAKSPQQMFGAVGKTWLAHNLGVDADKIYSISIMPCIAKKAERELPSMDSAGHGSDVDLVITTRELARMARAEHLDVENIAESAFDSPLGDGHRRRRYFRRDRRRYGGRAAFGVLPHHRENPSPDAFREVRDDGHDFSAAVARSDVRAGRPDCALRGSKRTGQRTSASALATAP